MELPAQDPDEINSLEAPATADVAGGGSDTPEGGGDNDASSPGDPKPAGNKKPRKKPGGTLLERLVSHINIYLLIFIFIMVLAGIGVFVSLQNAKKQTEEPTLTTQDLTQEALEQINESEVKVGDPKQTLAIESNAVFSGKVLVRDSLDIAGDIRVGGTVNLPGITVSGSSSFDQLQANNASVSGDVSAEGNLSSQGNLNVAGNATFGGAVSVPTLVVTTLQINGDITFTRHIDAGGPTPGVTKGTALGGGGTASVSGTDTAGTITISTGGGPGAGCFATVSFAQSFGGTPHVVATPVGSAAGGLDWYINRTSTNFSVCTANTPPAGANFAFDYIVID